MNKIVPLISSAVAGPLGVVHLPRLWLKVSLDSKGLLADGYPAIGTGFDQMVLDGLGLDKDAVTEYIRSEHPTYPQFEDWVRKQPGAKIDPKSIQMLNDSVRGYVHSGETRKGILTACGLEDTGKITDAVRLNELDDWYECHQAWLK
jgi:hypothetical protein